MANFKIQGTAPLSWSRAHGLPKLDRETHEDYENRTWKDKFWYNEDEIITIPSMSIINGLNTTAKRLSVKVQGRKTFTSIFKGGMTVFTGKFLSNCSQKQVKCEQMFVPSDGVAGSGKRVFKKFPVIDAGWEVEVELAILDNIITDKILTQHIEAMGLYVGLGRFRPGNGGYYGRFKISKEIEYIDK